VVSASNDDTLKVWDLESGRALATLEGHANWVMACAVTPDGQRVVSASADKTLKVWDLATYACLFTHRGDAPYLAVTASTTDVVAGDFAGGIWLLDWPPFDHRAPQLSIAERENRQHESRPAHSAHANPSPRRPMKKHTNPSLPSTTDVHEWKGKIDFGIITIREDEFEAMLQRVPDELGIASGRRQYNIRRLATDQEDAYTVAIVRCAGQGNGEAQQVANALLDELTPRWLLVVGIAGGAPASEFTLGDVVVSTQVCDFSVGAALKDDVRDYALQAWPTHPDALKHAANVSAMGRELGAWNAPKAIGVRRPKVEIGPKSLYGSPDWRKKVKGSLEHHFERTRKPKVTAGAIACSDLLMKDADLFQVWLRIARQVIAVEMESAGIHRAAYERQVPFLSIRGISDVVGFTRKPVWTAYACHSAAAFTCAFLRTRPIPAGSSPIVAVDPP
jgi:nucleoside phosphorylase